MSEFFAGYAWRRGCSRIARDRVSVVIADQSRVIKDQIGGTPAEEERIGEVGKDGNRRARVRARVLIRPWNI